MFVWQMNFIAHYHFQRNGDLHYNLGLVLPDLVKNFCKEHIKPGKPFVNPTLNAIRNGCDRHLEDDKIFHQSNFFKTCEHHLKELFGDLPKWPRKWFFNHLLIEILLDRCIMEMEPNVCNDFYEDLKNVNIEKTELFLKMSSIPNYQNFNPGFQRFVSMQFIFEYMHNERIFLALGRVYSRLGIEYEWTDYDKQLLLETIPKMLNFIELSYNHLQLELNK